MEIVLFICLLCLQGYLSMESLQAPAGVTNLDQSPAGISTGIELTGTWPERDEEILSEQMFPTVTVPDTSRFQVQRMKREQKPKKKKPKPGALSPMGAGIRVKRQKDKQKRISNRRTHSGKYSPLGNISQTTQKLV
ncbi:hypothetical protein GN956_G17556 [Arapaima gigas]